MINYKRWTWGDGGRQAPLVCACIGGRCSLVFIVRELRSVLRCAAGAQVGGKAWQWLITASSCAECGVALRGLRLSEVSVLGPQSGGACVIAAFRRELSISFLLRTNSRVFPKVFGYSTLLELGMN